MNKAQLNAAVTIAQDPKVTFITDAGTHIEDISVFDGFALPNFTSVVVTLRQLAFLIRWQCCQLPGGMDSVALGEIERIGRHKFTVVGQGA